jgi:WD40 repeat protein
VLSYCLDGRYVVVGDWDGALQIWDLQTMERRRSLHGSTSMITAVAVTPDGRYVVSGSDEGIRIWELATGLCKMVLHVSTPGGPNAVAVTSDGARAVLALSCGGIKIFDLQAGRIVRVHEGHPKRTVARPACAFTPDGLRICRTEIMESCG